VAQSGHLTYCLWVIQASPDVVARRLDDEVVLVHLATNRIYSLNATGGRYWELLEEGLGHEIIVRRMLDEFEVDRPSLEQEIADITAQLRREGLVTEA
jgi:Coenzyme PQQ synthesis protein D (PqqD)